MTPQYVQDVLDPSLDDACHGTPPIENHREMSDTKHPFYQMLKEDPRFKEEAYLFVREALSFGQDILHLGTTKEPDEECEVEQDSEEIDRSVQRHLTGQQLCEAIRQYASDRYGYMSKVVLNSWGVKTTSDLGDLVYNLIGIGEMRQSKNDLREDFNDVYDFDTAFQEQYKIIRPAED